MNKCNMNMNMKLKYRKILGYLPLFDFIAFKGKEEQRGGQTEGQGERGRLAARGSRLAARGSPPCPRRMTTNKKKKNNSKKSAAAGSSGGTSSASAAAAGAAHGYDAAAEKRKAGPAGGGPVVGAEVVFGLGDGDKENASSAIRNGAGRAGASSDYNAAGVDFAPAATAQIVEELEALKKKRLSLLKDYQAVTLELKQSREETSIAKEVR